jgi:transcriptional regulator with XRE-family HTH domain
MKNNEMISTNPIRYARMKHGLTQQQMSNLTGIPHRTIQNWEGGQRKCPEYVENMILNLLDQKFSQPDYQTILEEVLDMMERDLKHLKTDEARNYVSNVITDIKDSIK